MSTACNEFRASGRRAGSYPSNEGDEYMICKCGACKGDHTREAQKLFDDEYARCMTLGPTVDVK